MRPRSIKAGNHYKGSEPNQRRRVIVIFRDIDHSVAQVKYAVVSRIGDGPHRYVSLSSFARWADRCVNNVRGREVVDKNQKRSRR